MNVVHRAPLADNISRPRRRSGKGWLFCAWFAGLVLLTGVFGIFLAQPGTTLATVQDFGRLFPVGQDVTGWTVEPQPVAATVEMARAVSELLNYDAGLFISYSRGDIRISIYAAYWRLGKMSPRLVATHTPDVCWVGSGWVCRSTGFTELKAAEGRSLRLKHRIFTAPTGASEHLVFCHVVGGNPYEYGGFGKPPWYAILSELRGKGLKLREEQLFFRISSNQPLERFASAAPVQIFMSRLNPFLQAAKPDA